MKKLFGFIGVLSLFIMGSFLLLPKASANIQSVDSKAETIVEMKEELKDTFPEYSQYLSSLDKNNNDFFSRSLSNMSVDEEPQIIYSETREYDDDTEYSLVLFDNGTYASVQSWIGNVNWSGGTSNTGSGYTSYYNRQLTVWYNIAKFPMTFPAISYTLVNGAYDNFIDPGYGFLNGVGISANPYKKTENASGHAYAYFDGENELTYPNQKIDMQVRIEVGSDNIEVYLQSAKIY